MSLHPSSQHLFSANPCQHRGAGLPTLLMANYRVLVSDPISEKGVEALKNAEGVSVDVNTGLSPDELLKIIGDYHGLVVRSQTKVTAEVFAAAKNLKVIGRAGVGVGRGDEHTERQYDFHGRACVHPDAFAGAQHPSSPRIDHCR
jgi:D-isomer specific 2-hydroxyacid dehydrogenase, catalytic domain